MIIGEVSHCTPFIKAIKIALSSIFVSIWYPKCVEHCKLLKICLECMGVCVCMCGIALLKAKMFKAFAIYFSVYLLG